MSTTTTYTGVRIVDMPDLGAVTDDSSVVGEHAGSGRFGVMALRSYVGGAGATYTLKDFGGKSDGVTDDCNALTTAIAAILALPHGGKLTIPAGRTVIACPITAIIPAGKTLTIEGMGAGASELYFSAATNGMDFKLANAGTSWGSVHLRSFTLTRGPTSPVSANTGINIYVDTTAGVGYGGNSSVRDLVIWGSTPNHNQWQNSLVLSGVALCPVDNVVIKAVDSTATDTGDALLTLNGPNSSQFGVSYTVTNTTCQGGSCGILISGYVQGVFVCDSTIVGQYDSIRWLGTGFFPEDLSVVGCSLNARHRGVYVVGGSLSRIIGTTILHFSSGVANWAAIEFNEGNNNNVIACNIVANNDPTETGIIFSSAGASGATANSCIGNTMHGVGGRGIYLQGTTSATTVSANSIDGSTSPVHADTVGSNAIVGNVWNGATQDFSQAGGDPGVINVRFPINALEVNGTSILHGNVNAQAALTVGTGAGGFANLQLLAAHGSIRELGIFTDSSALTAKRWSIGASATAESGANAGSDFAIGALSDTGVLLGYPIGITRATMRVAFGAAVAFSTLPGNYTNDAAASAAGVPVGQVYRNGSVLQVRVA